MRSSKQDYIHASIVSTLLALMDGLDSRGQVSSTLLDSASLGPLGCAPLGCARARPLPLLLP
jgi:hypothetical protein